MRSWPGLPGGCSGYPKRTSPATARAAVRRHLRRNASPHRLAAGVERGAATATRRRSRANRIDRRAPCRFEDVVLVRDPPLGLGIEEVEGDDVDPAGEEGARAAATIHGCVCGAPAPWARTSVARARRPRLEKARDGTRRRRRRTKLALRSSTDNGNLEATRKNYFPMGPARPPCPPCPPTAARWSSPRSPATSPSPSASSPQRPVALDGNPRRGRPLVRRRRQSRTPPRRHGASRQAARRALSIRPRERALLLAVRRGAPAVQRRRRLRHLRRRRTARAPAHRDPRPRVELRRARRIARLRGDELPGRASASFGNARRATRSAQGLLEARDPTIPLVLAEDATAMAGLLLALLAVDGERVDGTGISGIRWERRHRRAALRRRPGARLDHARPPHRRGRDRRGPSFARPRAHAGRSTASTASRSSSRCTSGPTWSSSR